jgi:drug/metabolite transporter (DMT)-like permease
VTSLIFGANYWIAKGLMPEVLTPFQLVTLRVLVAGSIFWVLSLFIKHERVDRKDLIRIFIASVFGITINQLFVFIALSIASPVDISIIHVSNPIFVLIFAAILIREKITIYKVFGILLGATGALLLLLYENQVDFESDSFRGLVFAVINMLGYALYLVIVKPVMKKYHPYTVMKWVFMGGFITTIPVTFNEISVVSFSHFTVNNWLSLIYVIIAVTIFAYLFTIYALKHVDASVVSFYVYLQPFIVSGIALWMGQQHFTLSKLFAAMLIFTGVYLVSKKTKTLKA